MNIRWTPRVVIGLIVVITFIVLALAATKCNAQVYRADSITVTVPYSAAVDEWMTQRHHTSQWPAIIKNEWRELWKNRKNEARDEWKSRLADLFDFDGASGLTKADQNVLLQLKAKQDAFKIEQQRLADSTVAAKPVGMLMHIDSPREVVRNYNRSYAGKSYSPRLDFLGVSEVTPKPFRTNSPTFGGIASELAVPVIIGIIVIIFTIVAISQ